MNASSEKCQVCQKPAVNKCSACHKVYYCSKQHQKEDWKTHKTQCRPFQQRENDTLGRFVSATRPIRSGDLILKEAPLIWGPHEASIPICLGCAKAVDETNSKPCQKCGWPVCSELCEKAPGHLPECRYTSQRGKVTIKEYGIPHPIYKCITVLRCLYQKQFLPKVWKKLAALESHMEKRRGTKQYESDKVAVAEFIRRFFKLEAVFTEEDIMQVVGIVKVNAHEVPLSEPPHVAVYATTSLFEHDCAANCSKSFTNDGQIVISAAKAISPDEHLSICYTDPLWGTPNRRHFLNETKYFWCECARCKDPTEFGTFFSALKCHCSGKLLPSTFMDLQNLPNWNCQKCANSVTSYEAHDLLDRIGKELLNLNRNKAGDLKKFLEVNAKNHLAANHFYLTEVKYTLSQLLGQEKGLSALSNEDLALKLKICMELRDLLEIIAVAEKRTVGLVLFELHAAKAEIARRKGMESRNPEEIEHDLNESKMILQQAVENLKFEPDSMPEGKILLQAKQNLKDIDLVLRTIHARIGDSPV